MRSWVSHVIIILYLFGVAVSFPFNFFFKNPDDTTSSSLDQPELPKEEDVSGKQHRVFSEDYRHVQKERSKKAFKNKEALWPKAAVIYKTENSVGCPYSKQCQMLMRAMTHYQEHTCVRFKEWSGERDYVSIFLNRKSECWSVAGRIGGKQQLSLGAYCWFEGIVIHELGHALSFWDEMNRPDRDNYIDIFYDNIMPNMRPSFKKAEVSMTNLLEEPFDFNSIMMYDGYSFSKDGRSETIRAKTQEYLKPVWEKGVLSSLDIHKINKLYRCDGANQKPRFPTDVFCSFDDNSCGFKGISTQSWSWIPKYRGFWQSTGGFLQLNYETAANKIVRNWSINFHGLSPLDKTRGPLGCLSFSYSFSSDDNNGYLKLTQMVLDSPYELYYPGTPDQLWTATPDIAIAVPQWKKATIPLRVTQPFMLAFESNFGDETFDGSIRIDDFDLKYTPCPASKSIPVYPPSSVSSPSTVSTQPTTKPARARPTLKSWRISSVIRSISSLFLPF